MLNSLFLEKLKESGFDFLWSSNESQCQIFFFLCASFKKIEFLSGSVGDADPSLRHYCFFTFL